MAASTSTDGRTTKTSVNSPWVLTAGRRGGGRRVPHGFGRTPRVRARLISRSQASRDPPCVAGCSTAHPQDLTLSLPITQGVRDMLPAQRPSTGGTGRQAACPRVGMPTLWRKPWQLRPNRLLCLASSPTLMRRLEAHSRHTTASRPARSRPGPSYVVRRRMSAIAPRVGRSAARRPRRDTDPLGDEPSPAIRCRPMSTDVD